MSFVTTQPEVLSAAAAALPDIGATTTAQISAVVRDLSWDECNFVPGH